MFPTIVLLVAAWWSVTTQEVTVFAVSTTPEACAEVQRAMAAADIPGESWIKVECVPQEPEGEGV